MKLLYLKLIVSHIVCKVVTAQLFKARTPLTSTPPSFKIFCFLTRFFIQALLRYIIQSPHSAPPPAHPTQQPLLHHQIEDTYISDQPQPFKL